MLKTYDKESDIPEGLRAEYKLSGTKWVPDLSEDHPVLVLNKTLKQEKEVEEAKVKKLRSDLDDALEAGKTSGVPRGQALVAKADAEDLPKYRALGSVDEVTAMKTEHGTLKEKDAQRVREDVLRKVAKAHNYNEEAFVLLQNLPDFTSRPSKDGKSVDWFAQLKGDKGVITEKPVKEFVESAEHIKPFMSSLTQKSSDGVRVPTSGPTTQHVENDPVKWARDWANNYSKVNSPTTNLVDAWNGVSKPA